MSKHTTDALVLYCTSIQSHYISFSVTPSTSTQVIPATRSLSLLNLWKIWMVGRWSEWPSLS